MELKLKDNSKLKLGYTQLEYIESTGTQWIDTGISFPNGFRSVTKLYPTNVSSYKDYAGAFQQNLHNIHRIDGGRWSPCSGNTCKYYSTVSVNTLYEVDMSNANGKYNLIVNGSTLANDVSASTGYSSLTCWLFAMNRTDNTDYQYYLGRIYEIYLYDENDVLKFHGIPALDLNNVVCMYDTVSNQFFYNQGTGNFVGGHAISYVFSNNILLKTTTFYHKNTPNVNGLQLLNGILNYQKTNQYEIKEYYYPTTQLWQDIITEYPDIVQYYNMDHKLCIPICDADDPEQFTEDLLEIIDDYPDIIDVIVDYPDISTSLVDNPNLAPTIAENPEVIHSLIDTGYETWLQADGSSWLTTNYYINGNTDVECRACILQYNQNQNATPMLYGGALNYKDIGGEMYGFGEFTFNYYTNSVIFSTSQVPVNVKFKATTTAGFITILLDNGTTVTGGSTNRLTFTSDVPTVVFALNRGVVGYKSATSKLSSLKFKEGIEDKLWLVPIQNNGNPCMIDLLTGTKYLNQGTGSFTYSLEHKNA